MRDQLCFETGGELRCDTLVLGGGTTGIAAALASARNGADTLIVERNGYFGGNGVMIPAWLGFFGREGRQLVGGIAWELAEKIRREAPFPIYHDPFCCSICTINGDYLKLIAAQEIVASGARPMLHSVLVGVEADGNEVRAARLWSGERMIRVECRNFIDCSDSAVGARLAGEELVSGRRSDGRHQISSWVFEVGNLDMEKIFQYFEQYPEDIRPFPLEDPAAHLRDIRRRAAFVMGGFARLVAQAERDGMRLPRKNVPGQMIASEGRFLCVGSRLEEVLPADAENYSNAECAGAAQAKLYLSFFRRYVPGFENCKLLRTPDSMGIREINHLAGSYLLTEDDLLSGRSFEDAVALGDYHLDIHSPDHRGIDTKIPPVYTIPYRALLGKKNRNLLAAGRCASQTHEAQSSTRVIPISMAMGEAAGTAAALAARQGVPAAELDPQILRRRLLARGVLLAPGKHLKEMQ